MSTYQQSKEFYQQVVRNTVPKGKWVVVLHGQHLYTADTERRAIDWLMEYLKSNGGTEELSSVLIDQVGYEDRVYHV